MGLRMWLERDPGYWCLRGGRQRVLMEKSVSWIGVRDLYAPQPVFANVYVWAEDGFSDCMGLRITSFHSPALSQCMTRNRIAQFCKVPQLIFVNE